VRRFELFVDYYDGLDPYDVHLRLQTTKFVDSSGDLLPISYLYPTSDLEKGWADIAKRVGAKAFLSKNEVKRARERGRHTFDKDLVSVTTKRKICRLLALDYCCLNFELPKECKGVFGKDDSVFCAIKPNDESVTEESEQRFLIQPWLDL